MIFLIFLPVHYRGVDVRDWQSKDWSRINKFCNMKKFIINDEVCFPMSLLVILIKSHHSNYRHLSQLLNNGRLIVYHRGKN